MDGFGDVCWVDLCLVFKVSDGAGYFYDAVIGACGEGEFFHVFGKEVLVFWG